MPVTIKTNEPKADVPFAKSPEFAKLQDAISQAKEVLDDVSRQIVAIESKLNPTARPNGRPGGDDIPTATDALGAPQPSQSPQPDPSPLPNTGPADSSPGMRGRLGFEEAIEDMRRIAGLR